MLIALGIFSAITSDSGLGVNSRSTGGVNGYALGSNSIESDGII